MTTEPGAGTPPASEDALLVVGRIVKAHGLRGEVVVDLYTDRTERLRPGSELVAGAGTTLRVDASRRHQDRWLVTFEGLATREAAEAHRGEELRAAPVAADEGTWWVHELVGAAVVDPAGRRLGRVTAVEPNPASDLLVLGDGSLVPLSFVVAHRPGVEVTVDVPPGLLPEGAPEPGPAPDAGDPRPGEATR